MRHTILVGKRDNNVPVPGKTIWLVATHDVGKFKAWLSSEPSKMHFFLPLYLTGSIVGLPLLPMPVSVMRSALNRNSEASA